MQEAMQAELKQKNAEVRYSPGMRFFTYQSKKHFFSLISDNQKF